MEHKATPRYKRLWKFAALIDGRIHYLLEDGKCISDPNEAPNWIGSDNEADKEASRRSDLHEDACGGFVERVTYESQGRVDAPTKIPAAPPKKALQPGPSQEQGGLDL